jgi:hypothetical protein
MFRPRLVRILAAAPIGALLAVGLSIIPATVVQAQVVKHTKAGEVTGALAGAEIRQLPFVADHAALYWEGNQDANLTVAFSADGVRFGRPLAVEEDEVGMQLRNGKTYGAVLPASGATAARITSDRPIGKVTILALAEDGTSVEKKQVPKSAGAQTTAVTVHPRSDWNADETLRFKGTTQTWPPVFQTVQRLVVHHTAGANGESGETARSTIRSIYYYHTVTQGWGDIGYNFLIDDAGVIYKGRSTSTTTTDGDITGENAASQGVTAGHAYGYNSGSIGVAVLGNYVSTAVSSAADGALKNFLVSKVSAHGMNAHTPALYTNPTNGNQDTFENVPGHTEVPNNTTECPGGTFLTRLHYMRDEVAAAAALIGPPDTAPPSDPTNVTAVLNRRTVNLTWKASPGDNASPGGVASGVVGYDVWRSAGVSAPIRLASTTGLTYTDNATTRGTTYTYFVRTFDGASYRSSGASPLKPVTV